MICGRFEKLSVSNCRANFFITAGFSRIGPSLGEQIGKNDLTKPVNAIETSLKMHIERDILPGGETSEG